MCIRRGRKAMAGRASQYCRLKRWERTALSLRLKMAARYAHLPATLAFRKGPRRLEFDAAHPIVVCLRLAHYCALQAHMTRPYAVPARYTRPASHRGVIKVINWSTQ